ncbi:30S ribosomal protein S7 [Pasteuria penetrans]|uniref:30S ribosomal protein S7 n=1 Tax=Pasteuria penetrans TaxID=86005 RepID=UPI000F9BC228|nr:30S ribosomal protein S7 [Pasteuria penetrans]
MPRKGPVPRREVIADPVYGSKLVTRLMNRLMYDGQKGKAQRILYGSMEKIREESEKDPLTVLEQALENVMPVLEVKARRVGGANYQVPVEVKPERRTSLAIRWIVDFARKHGEKTMQDRLTREILDAANGTGAAVKKKEDTHRMAEANRAFAHYRW